MSQVRYSMVGRVLAFYVAQPDLIPGNPYNDWSPASSDL